MVTNSMSRMAIEVKNKILRLVDYIVYDCTKTTIEKLAAHTIKCSMEDHKLL